MRRRIEIAGHKILLYDDQEDLTEVLLSYPLLVVVIDSLTYKAALQGHVSALVSKLNPSPQVRWLTHFGGLTCALSKACVSYDKKQCLTPQASATPVRKRKEKMALPPCFEYPLDLEVLEKLDLAAMAEGYFLVKIQDN